MGSADTSIVYATPTKKGPVSVTGIISCACALVSISINVVVFSDALPRSLSFGELLVIFGATVLVSFTGVVLGVIGHFVAKRNYRNPWLPTLGTICSILSGLFFVGMLIHEISAIE